MSDLLGWCLPNSREPHGCPGFIAYTSANNHGTHNACGCTCHQGEERMAHSGKSTARAYRPTAADLESGAVAAGTEVLLEITDTTIAETVYIETSFAGAHAARDVLADLLHANASKSIVQQLEDDLDGVFVRLMAEPTDEDKGWARGLATAIAHMRGCDIDTVREQAMERYEAAGSPDE